MVWQVWQEGARGSEWWEWVARGRGALRALGKGQGPGERVVRERLPTGWQWEWSIRVSQRESPPPPRKVTPPQRCVPRAIAPQDAGRVPPGLRQREPSLRRGQRCLLSFRFQKDMDGPRAAAAPLGGPGGPWRQSEKSGEGQKKQGRGEGSLGEGTTTENGGNHEASPHPWRQQEEARGDGKLGERMEAKAEALHAAGTFPLSTPGGEGVLKSSEVWVPISQPPGDHAAKSGPWASCQHLRRLGLCVPDSALSPAAETPVLSPLDSRTCRLAWGRPGEGA